MRKITTLALVAIGLLGGLAMATQSHATNSDYCPPCPACPAGAMKTTVVIPAATPVATQPAAKAAECGMQECDMPCCSGK